MIKTPALSARVLTQLDGWGLTPPVLQRLGAFAVVWGLFETNLERTVWALTGENVHGERPSTDRTPLPEWIEELGKPRPLFATEALAVLAEASHVAKDLMEYRHAIAHGTLLLIPGAPTFLRNPRWNRVQRARPSHSAHVDENLLDMAIVISWTLVRVVGAAQTACNNPAEASALIEMKSEVREARSMANELRHLDELMNSEKY